MVPSIPRTGIPLILLGAVAALLAGSGCASAPTGGSSNRVDTLYSDPSRDGWVDNSGNASTTTVPLVGDFNGSGGIAYYRQVFSFAFGGLPQTAQIVSAKLVLNQGQVFGDPYGKFGSVKVYHITLGSPLSLADYLSSPLPPNNPTPLTISTTATLGTRELLVTNWVSADLGQGRERSEFRLQFSGAEGNQDATDDAAYFTDAAVICCPGALPPRLVITWF